MTRLSLLLVFLFVISCSTTPKTELTGKWLMYKVLQNGKDVTAEHNPENERFLILKSDNTFESGGRPYGENAGSYRFDPKENTLFLDSDTGPQDDSQWKVRMQGDTMYWQGFGSEWATGFELVHLRAL